MAMNKKVVIGVLLLVAIVIFGLSFVYWFGKEEAPLPEETGEVEDAPERIITAMHQYGEGAHIIAGEIDLPTPCHALNVTASVNTDADPDSVTVAFTVSADEEEFCAQVITPHRFKVEFDADQNALIQATYNGAPARLNLVEVGSEEDLENFEVFIKG